LETLYHPELAAMKQERWERQKKEEQNQTADSDFKKAFTQEISRLL
jgi:hypothetical protein